MKRSLLFLVLVALTRIASANHTSSNIEVAHGGSGCPAGTLDSSISEDGSTLTLHPREYIVQAGGFSNKTFDRKSCNVAIPISVGPGYQVALAVEINGFAHVQSGYANIQSESFTAGSSDQTKKINFRTGTSREFKLSDTSFVGNTFSECGKDTILRLNSSLMARGSALLAVEKINLKLLYRKCRH